MNRLVSPSEYARAAAAGRRPKRNESVGVVTLADVWASHLNPHPEEADDIILVVDAEGAEGTILAGAAGLGLPAPLPRLVLFEV